MSYNKPIILQTTPGPWQWLGGNAIWDNTNHLVATTVVYKEDLNIEHSRCVGNAKLIATAPELLQAFNAILENFPIEVLKDQLNEDYELIENVIEKLK